MRSISSSDSPVASVLARVLAALLLGAAIGALALRPSPLLAFQTPRWLDTPGLVAAWGLRLDAISLIVIAFGAAALAARTGAAAARFVAPLIALVGLALAGDATLLSLFWLIALFASQRAAAGTSRTDGALALAYFGGFALVAATIVGTPGASTMLQPRLAGSIDTVSLLLGVLAAVSALPLLVACDDAEDGVSPALLALACAILLVRSAIVWGASASTDVRLAAAALSLVGSLLASRLGGRSGSTRSASVRMLAVEIGLIGAALAIGGPGGVAIGVVLVLNLGLSAIPLVAGGDRASVGAFVGLGALAGLPPLPGFVGRALLLGLCLERGYWGIAAGVAVLAAWSIVTFAALATSPAGRGERPSGPAEEPSLFGAGSLLLAAPLLVVALVSAVGTAATFSALELAGVDAIAPRVVGIPAIAILFVATLAGTIWSGEEARQSDLRLRRDRLRDAALARERARRADGVSGEGEVPVTAKSPLAVVGERLAEASALAITFQIAILLLGLVVVAFQTGRF